MGNVKKELPKIELDETCLIFRKERKYNRACTRL